MGKDAHKNVMATVNRVIILMGPVTMIVTMAGKAGTVVEVSFKCNNCTLI